MSALPNENTNIMLSLRFYCHSKSLQWRRANDLDESSKGVKCLELCNAEKHSPCRISDTNGEADVLLCDILKGSTEVYNEDTQRIELGIWDGNIVMSKSLQEILHLHSPDPSSNRVESHTTSTLCFGVEFYVDYSQIILCIKLVFLYTFKNISCIVKMDLISRY